VIPKDFHVLYSNFDGFNIFDSFVDLIWMAKLASVLTKVNNLIFEHIEFTEDASKFLKGILRSTFILEELPLFHFLSELSNVFFQSFDVMRVLVVLLAN
jgi:hypothetical protein